MDAQARWLARWSRRGPAAAMWWPLSLAYGMLLALRRSLYRHGVLASVRLPVPVLVVGNVVVGGAGKTPVVAALARHLALRGVGVGIVSRGYGRRGSDCREVLAGSTPDEVGDEPLLLRHATGVPVFVGPLRAEAGRNLLARHPHVQLLLCDDGLQHLALQRDLEICVFDERGIGNGWLLPAGPLREAWPRPVDMVLRSAAAAMPLRLPAGVPAFDAPRRLADHARGSDGRRVPLDSLHGHPIAALAGIAHPERFFTMLRQAGLHPAHALPLPDHHDFSRGRLPDWPGCALLCTEKDAPKLWPLRPDALAVPLHCEPEPAFWDALHARLAPLLATAGG